MLSDPDPEKAQRVRRAMLKMKKSDAEAIGQAYNQSSKMKKKDGRKPIWHKPHKTPLLPDYARQLSGPRWGHVAPLISAADFFESSSV